MTSSLVNVEGRSQDHHTHNLLQGAANSRLTMQTAPPAVEERATAPSLLFSTSSTSCDCCTVFKKRRMTKSGAPCCCLHLRTE